MSASTSVCMKILREMALVRSAPISDAVKARISASQLAQLEAAMHAAFEVAGSPAAGLPVKAATKA